jgi:hypothetical protein
MKRTTGFGVLLAFATFFTSFADAQVVTYSYSGPVGGWTGVDLSPAGQGSGGFVASFGTLTETFYYDTVAQTLETVASVTVNPSSASFLMQNAPYLPPESGSATLTVGNNGSLSFNATAYPGGTFYPTLYVPVSGSGTYNGQAFSGSWSFAIPLFGQVTALSPTSLTFSEYQEPNGNYGPGSIGVGRGVPGVIPGTDLNDAQGDGTYYYNWQLNSAVATAVPEPTTLVLGAPLLLLFGKSAWRRLRKRQMP